MARCCAAELSACRSKPLRIVRVALAAHLVMAMVGCVSVERSLVESHPERVRNELATAIVERRPQDVIPRLGPLERERVLPASELADFRSSAVAIVQDLYQSALEDKRYSEAVRHYRNLVVLGEVEQNDDLLTSLIAGDAESLLADGNLPIALATLISVPRLSSLTDEQLSTAADIAVRLNNRYAIALLGEANQDWARANPQIMDFASERPGPVRMSEGVVTIWVDRGLRIVGGVGMPDRVVGSGFFVDPRGYIVTNYHVVQSEVDPEYRGYSRVFVRLASDPVARIPARVVGHSRAFDIALLKIEVDAPYVFSFTDTRVLDPGTRIVAIGSPGGLENTITSGIISATGRRFLQLGDAMQVDVPINPGNSGGPLIDDHGRLVGVVFAGIPQFDGVNFAIPAFWVTTFLRNLFDDGPVAHPWLGVAVEPASGGLEVTYVALGSPAAQAGLEVGDTISRMNGWEVSRVAAAQSVLLRRAPDSFMNVEWLRDGERIEGFAVLGERPQNPVAVALDRDLRERVYPALFGMQVERTGQLLFRPSYSVTRVFRGSVADETGITVGDTFTETGFEYDRSIEVAFLRMLINKRTQGFLRTSIQIPAYVERDNFL